jgi:hypothetical protein
MMMKRAPAGVEWIFWVNIQVWHRIRITAVILFTNSIIFGVLGCLHLGVSYRLALELSGSFRIRSTIALHSCSLGFAPGGRTLGFY